MTHVLQDLRFAARQLAAQRSFAAIAIVTLSLGIGAATTCFSVLNALALRPIPFPDPDRLVAIRVQGPPGSGARRLSAKSVRGLQQLHDVLSGSVGFATRTVSAAAPGIAAERVPATEVTGDLFSLLGVPVQIGRPLTAADTGSRVAVIGDDVWGREFGSNRDVVGTALTVDGDQFIIVGVAAPGFSFPQDSRVWLPFSDTAVTPTVDVVARIHEGVTAAHAAGALRAASSEILAGAPLDDRNGWMLSSIPLRQIMLATKQRNMAEFVLTAAGLVLLIACANLAGLLTAQLGSRAHEIAVRSAIGASRRRVVQQLMTESALIALAGGALGVLLAQWGVDLFAATVGKPQGAEWIDMSVDGRVLLFALLASTVTAFLFGLLPAIGSSRVDLRSILQEDRTIAAPRVSGRRLRAVLVASQVGLSICLVAGAMSIVISSMSFEGLDPGFNRAGLLTMKVALSGRAYQHPEQRQAFIDAAVRRLRVLPGVSAAAAASHVPLVDRDPPWIEVFPEGIDGGLRPLHASLRFVDAEYLTAMGIPIRRGRAFSDSESHDLHGHVVVIDDTMARRYWPDRDPVGSHLRLAAAGGLAGSYEVVGVAAEVAQRNLPATPENQIYLPIASAPDLTLVVRTPGDAASIAASARDAVRGLDSSVAVTAQTMTAAFRWYVMDRRMQGIVLAVVGAVAVLAAALGIYGVLSVMVTERSREFAIRRALGASRTSVIRLVLRRGIGLSAAGAGVGLLLAAALTAFLSSIFLGVRAFDVSVLAGSAALLGGVAVVASWWPAQRATRFDPAVTLKQ
jgi:predicted permease